ncbi:PAAR domain-containing protein [Limnobaculum zhutongyuii]|uniref:PAAR domain-containing protein n=1 Tax=Limnobaculum zhutongyuii TaxID=2498113 RepID=A0A411WJ58_9GAMM|nr:PAAR domain-containing protein [Limnobaculum zhutongyuii]QBH96223.1 PAAR domain-containing protein [Limnobaculum zhutongyuii]TQS86188.1 PAAR domain-containing protein [Limnobaculum zhutongyuii]
MSKGIIRLGDRTTHGGNVITATSTMVMDGKKVALIGDLVDCPKSGHGVNPIIEGSSDWISDGKQVAVDGCRCACGCTLITSLPEVLIG